MNNIFISYRRADSADVVGRIYDYLEGIVGKDNIFKDVHSVQLGIDYLEFTADILSKCDVQLAIIGKQWLTGRRIDNEDDLVRVEIETAMARDIPVIPVLVGGAEMPAEEDLPDSLKPLAYRNAIQVRPDPDFPFDMSRLVGALERIIPINPVAKPHMMHRLPWVAGILIAVALVVYFTLPSGFEDSPGQLASEGDSAQSAQVRSIVQDPVRVDRAMEFVDRYGAESLLDARKRVSEAVSNGMDALNDVLKDSGLVGKELAAAYNNTIIEIVAAENLASTLEQLFDFHEQQLRCRENQLCDESVAAEFFDDDAQDLTNTFYPWVCKVRADWNNPAEYEQVLDFYVKADSATVCES